MIAILAVAGALTATQLDTMIIQDQFSVQVYNRDEATYNNRIAAVQSPDIANFKGELHHDMWCALSKDSDDVVSSIEKLMVKGSTFSTVDKQDHIFTDEDIKALRLTQIDWQDRSRHFHDFCRQ